MTYSCTTPATAWRTSVTLPLTPAGPRKAAAHEAGISFGGARDAEIPPQPGAAFRLARVAAGSVGYPGQRFRRQYQERGLGCGQPGSRTRIGGRAGEGPRDRRERANL